MAEDVLIIYFPNEVLEHILEDKNLFHNDIYNFGLTCSKFRKVLDSNKLWKTKFQQRWPSLLTSSFYKEQDTIDWKDNYENRLRISRTTNSLLKSMSHVCYKKEELSHADYNVFVELIPTHIMALSFMIHELMLLVHHTDLFDNLTTKFYANKVLSCLRHIEVSKKWEKFKNDPPEKQILERGAVIIAQWCQADLEITDELISNQLDYIVDCIRNVLKLEYGERHPALCVSTEDLAGWRTSNISDNQFNATISRQIIAAASEVLFNQMGFHGDSEMYYLPENSYINKVLDLRQGIPITLSIVFESVTRRLGVKCEPVSFPGHFLLRWRDHYKNEGLAGQPQYIDVFNGGQFLTKESCPNFTAQRRCPMHELFRCSPATAIQVVERMANNLEVAGRQRSHTNGRLARLRTVLELLQLINPCNLSCLLQLARLYILYNLNKDVEALLDNINNMEIGDPRDQGQAANIKRMLEVYLLQETKRKEMDVEETTVCTRGMDVDVSFAVGMVMHHKKYNYTCVIFGWDSKCAADEEWRLQMNVFNLPRKDEQPFYNVLVGDGSTRYAAEDNLEIATEMCWIDHYEIGRYFHKFCGTHYLPNDEKENEYPDDKVIRASVYNSTEDFTM
uniref:Hemimethylated DNA-binding domain-containing protein n=1 Tax=Clastoptera arizonana TaxID=38151 RepID=A0A1B6E1X2_9HEMI